MGTYCVFWLVWVSVWVASHSCSGGEWGAPWYRRLHTDAKMVLELSANDVDELNGGCRASLRRGPFFLACNASCAVQLASNCNALTRKGVTTQCKQVTDSILLGYS